MTIHCFIRTASIEDAESMAPLIEQLGYASDAGAARERLGRLLASDRDAVLIAVVDGSIGAWMHVLVSSSLESDDYAEIRGLVVAERFRNGGIGARLVAAAEEWARSRGLTRVRVRSNVIRKDAHRFYERRGYRVTKSQAVFDRTL